MFPKNNFNILMRICSMVTLFSLLTICSLAFGQDLVATPDKITFHNLNQEAIVKVTYKNQPLKKEHVQSWSFLAGDHQYNHMVHLKFADDKIIITPALLETGSYDLVIKTSFGKCTIAVDAPLDELPDTLEKQAQKEGISVDELKKRLGLVTPVRRVDIHIDLPSTYYEGQTVELNLEKDKDVYYIWRVNNQIIKQGKEESSFSYTFPEPGNYVIEVEEKDGDILLGKASATTKVISYEPIPCQTKINQPIQLSAPEGYASYTWKVDGVTQNESGNLITLKLNSEKKYTVECIAKGPKNGNPQSFFRTIYEITVSK